MGFNLFKKKGKKENKFDDIMRGPPSLSPPPAPRTENHKKKLVPPREIPRRPEKKHQKEDFPKSEHMALKRSEMNRSIPKAPSLPSKPKESMHVEKEDELPAFPEHEDISGFKEAKRPEKKNIPKPPSYFSKMDDVREDMSRDYVEHEAKVSLIKKPIFVEVNEYKKLRKTIRAVERDAKKSKDIAESLEEIKKNKEESLGKWDKELERAQRNLIFVNKMLFEEGSANV